MASQHLIYADALQNDNDINRVLLAFQNLRMDPPSTHATPLNCENVVRPSSGPPPSLKSPQRLRVDPPPTQATSFNRDNVVRLSPGPSPSIISQHDSDFEDDRPLSSISSLTDSDSDDNLYPSDHNHDENSYWATIDAVDGDAFWDSETTSSMPSTAPPVESVIAPNPTENTSPPLGRNAVGAEDDENDYLVSAGRETRVVRTWCVPAPHRSICFCLYFTPQAQRWPCLPRCSGRKCSVLGRNHAPSCKRPPQGRLRSLRGTYSWNLHQVVRIYILPRASHLTLAENRSDAEAQVTEVPGNVHQGFSSRLEAEQAYIVAYAMGCVRSLPRRGSTDRAPDPAMPTPTAILDAFGAVSDDFLGAEWHVVFKGKAPGIYPAW